MPQDYINPMTGTGLQPYQVSALQSTTPEAIAERQRRQQEMAMRFVKEGPGGHIPTADARAMALEIDQRLAQKAADAGTTDRYAAFREQWLPQYLPPAGAAATPQFLNQMRNHAGQLPINFREQAIGQAQQYQLPSSISPTVSQPMEHAWTQWLIGIDGLEVDTQTGQVRPTAVAELQMIERGLDFAGIADVMDYANRMGDVALGIGHGITPGSLTRSGHGYTSPHLRAAQSAAHAMDDAILGRLDDPDEETLSYAARLVAQGWDRLTPQQKADLQTLIMSEGLTEPSR